MKRIILPTKEINAALVDVLNRVKPGQRIRITQTVRVGERVWTTTVEGVYRDVNYLATGTATDRVPEDDIVVPTVHFTKDTGGAAGELSSIAIDENTQVEILD